MTCVALAFVLLKLRSITCMHSAGGLPCHLAGNKAGPRCLPPPVSRHTHTLCHSPGLCSHTATYCLNTTSRLTVHKCCHRGHRARVQSTPTVHICPKKIQQYKRINLIPVNVSQQVHDSSIMLLSATPPGTFHLIRPSLRGDLCCYVSKKGEQKILQRCFISAKLKLQCNSSTRI